MYVPADMLHAVLLMSDGLTVWLGWVQMGFFADAGPLQIFVSQHLIPSHYQVEITDDASFESEENAPPIKAGAAVRVRLVGIKVEANQLVC